jgi:hypothetical protein
MNDNEEVLERIKELCELITELDNRIIGIPSDDHVELSNLILNIINKTK